MNNYRKDIQKLEGVSLKQMRESKVKTGYKDIKCYMIFDIKIDVKVSHKKKFDPGGHRTDPPSSIKY